MSRSYYQSSAYRRAGLIAICLLGLGKVILFLLADLFLCR